MAHAGIELGWFSHRPRRTLAPLVDDRPPRPDEPTVHATWACPNPVCRVWTRPSQSGDGVSCHLCGEPRPAHLTARAEQAAAVRRAA